MNRIVVVGGGITGLAAAHRIGELNPAMKVTLLEASARLGGTIQTEYRDGFLLERGPDSFISEKTQAISLAKRLGLESHLIETNEAFRRSFILRNGRLRPVPEGFQLLAPARMWPFITSDIFSLTGKVRMAADLFLPRKSANGVNDESLASFVRRGLGNEALTRMAHPMVGGIYAADPETLSLRATLPRFLDMEQKHRSLILAMLRKSRAQSGTSGARYGLFLSFDHGMEVLVQALKDKISGCEIKLNTKVAAIVRERGWKLRTDKNETIHADAVCLAVPAYVAAQVLTGVNQTLAAQFNQIKYASTATINIAFRREAIQHPLDGFGFVVPFVEKRSLIACSFSSVKFPGRAPDDHVLLRVFVGGALQPEMFGLDETEMLNRVESDLHELLGITSRPL